MVFLANRTNDNHGRVNNGFSFFINTLQIHGFENPLFKESHMKQPQLLLLLITLTSFTGCNDNPTPQKADETQPTKVAYPGVNTPECTAPAEWFVLVDGTRKTPAPNEGPTSVFANNDTVSNCDFHQWSWQKFLWLTNEVDGQPMFMDLNQVTSHGQKIDPTNGIILTEKAQASGHKDVLTSPHYSTG